MSSFKAKKWLKRAKREIETAAADAPVSLMGAAIYLHLTYQSAWKLKNRGVLDVEPVATAANPPSVFVTVGSVRAPARVGA